MSRAMWTMVSSEDCDSTNQGVMESDQGVQVVDNKSTTFRPTSSSPSPSLSAASPSETAPSVHPTALPTPTSERTTARTLGNPNRYMTSLSRPEGISNAHSTMQQERESITQLATRALFGSGGTPRAPNPTAKRILDSLPRIVACKALEEQQKVCTLCLEEVKQGDIVTMLSCGHFYHLGHLELELDQVLGRPEGCCRGILYWLKSNNTCPHCRLELERECPVAASSNTARRRLVVPLLNRQLRLIYDQSQVIDRQRQQIAELHRRLATLNGGPPATAAEEQEDESRTPIPEHRRYATTRGRTTRILPLERDRATREGSWHDPDRDFAIRTAVSRQILLVALTTMKVQSSMMSRQKFKKLEKLVAKVELNLYRSAPNLEEYRCFATLRRRVMEQIRTLVRHARSGQGNGADTATSQTV